MNVKFILNYRLNYFTRLIRIEYYSQLGGGDNHEWNGLF